MLARHHDMMNAEALRRGRSFLGAAFAVFLAGVSTSSCTVFVDTNAHQCETTADCAAFPGAVCSERNVCVLGATKCLDNATCVDRHGSETYFCQKPPGQVAGECSQLLSDQCKTLHADPGDLRSDDAVILSLFFMPSWFPLLKGGVDAAELVRRDFKQYANGLPPVRGGKKPRPIVFLECDVPFGDQGQNRAATDHIFKLGIQGSLGPIIGDWMSYWLGKATTLPPNGPTPPTMITTGNKFPGFDEIKGTQNLFFTVGIPSEGRAKAYAQVTSVWEQSFRDAGTTRDLKVAFISPQTAAYFAVPTALRKFATFNSKSVDANESAKLYKEFGWGDTSLNTDPNYLKAVDDVIAFKPDIVICDGGTLCADLPMQIETSVTASNIRYVIGQEGQQANLIDAVGTNESFRKRILGTRPGRSESYQGFQLFKRRFLTTFNEPAEAQGFAGAAYDMAYELLLAIAAVGDEPLTGPNIGKAIQTRFKKGGVPFKTYEAGISIVKALQALQAGQNLDIDGTTHSGYFDETGQNAYEGQIWCISADQTLSNRFTDTGLTFTQADATLKGTNTCF